MSGVASFHIVRERRATRALAHLGTDRRRLAAVPGLRFWRLLGTGAGRRTSIGADLRRTALFAVWRDEAALDAFLATSIITQRWAAAEEAYTVRLARLGGHGRWRGFDVLDAIAPASSKDGPVAVLTRARVRPAAWPRFTRAGLAVSAEVGGADGLRAVVGIGEAPMGRLATFSVWSSVAAMHEYARHAPAHAAVIRRTRAERWYGEELFARFAPYGSSGTWDGVDPIH